MGHFASHFVFVYIINCLTLTKFKFSVWSSAMPNETESMKKKLDTSKRGVAQWLLVYTLLYFGIFLAPNLFFSDLKVKTSYFSLATAIFVFSRSKLPYKHLLPKINSKCLNESFFLKMEPDYNVFYG